MDCNQLIQLGKACVSTLVTEDWPPVLACTDDKGSPVLPPTKGVQVHMDLSMHTLLVVACANHPFCTVDTVYTLSELKIAHNSDAVIQRSASVLTHWHMLQVAVSCQQHNSQILQRVILSKMMHISNAFVIAESPGEAHALL